MKKRKRDRHRLKSLYLGDGEQHRVYQPGQHSRIKFFQRPVLQRCGKCHRATATPKDAEQIASSHNPTVTSHPESEGEAGRLSQCRQSNTSGAQGANRGVDSSRTSLTQRSQSIP